MKIVVCIKQVPDTTEVRLDPVKNTLIRDGVPSIINPDDRSGIELALRIKETIPESNIVAVSMGPPQADAALREALAMGCDEALLLSDRAFGGADTWATSSTIAGALRKLGYDIIISGRQAIDGDTAQVGPQIAEHLAIPQVTYCEELSFEGKSLLIKRQFEDRYHIVEINPPCLLTTLSEKINPRYMTLGGIFEAYKKEVKTWGLKDIQDYLNVEHIGLKGSPTKVLKSFTKQAKGKGVKMENLNAEDAADLILAKLQKKYII